MSGPSGDTAIPVEVLGRLRHALGRLGRSLRQNRLSPDDGLPYPEVSLLLNIFRSQPVSLSELATTEGIAPPSITRSLNRLQEQGLVRREPDPKDGRVVRASLTPAGEAECDAIRQRRDRWLVERMKRLDAQEQRALLQAIEALEKLAAPD